MKREFTYLSHDGKTRIHAICWIPEGEVRAILQISHGMVEYIDRYREFAGYLAARGILVAGNDHLGHGQSVLDEEHLGFFARNRGNEILLRDLHRLNHFLRRRYPGVPCFLLGHSMGSFLARQYLCRYGEELDGAVIMGTGATPQPVALFGMGLCRALATVFGWNYRSRLVDAIAFAGNNRSFGSLTGREWLSRNEENVANYLQDPLCTFRFTLNGYYNLFYSLHSLGYRSYLERMPRQLPVLFVSGEQDPVGKFGKSVKKVYEQFRQLGMEQVSCKLYPEDRHEILNEVDRETVYADLAGWIFDHCLGK